MIVSGRSWQSLGQARDLARSIQPSSFLFIYIYRIRRDRLCNGEAGRRDGTRVWHLEAIGTAGKSEYITRGAIYYAYVHWTCFDRGGRPLDCFPTFQNRRPPNILRLSKTAAPKPARIPPMCPAESVPEAGLKMAPYASYANIPPITAHAGRGRTKKRRNWVVGKRAP